MQCGVECSAPVRCSSAIALWGGVERVGVQWCGVAGVKQSDVGCSSAVQCGAVEWSATALQCGVESVHECSAPCS